MSLTLTAPCTRVDLGEIYGPVSAELWALAVHQLTLGPSFAFQDATGRAVAGGGYIPFGDSWEAWFHASPAASAHMLAFTRLARLTFAALPDADPRPIETVVRTDAGRRIARAMGFSLAMECGGGLELWRRERWAAL